MSKEALLCCNHLHCRREVQRVLAEAFDEFAAFLHEKATIAEGTVPVAFGEGVRNAAVDAELFLTAIQGKWQDAKDVPIPDPDEVIETARCWSLNCIHPGYIKSERYGGYLCPTHAVRGPVTERR